MVRTIYVDCPCCQTRLEVDAENGKVLNQWKKADKDSHTDAMAEGLKKLHQDKQRRENLLRQSQEEMAKKKKNLEEQFQKGLDQAKKEGPQKPMNPFDLE